MKRILALALVTVMTASLFVACGKKNTEEPSQTPAQTEAPTVAPTEEPTVAPTETPAETPAQDGELTAMIDKIYENKPVELMLATIPVDIADPDALASYTGLQDASKIKDVVVSEPMMGSQAYSLVLVKVNDSADAEAIADEMKAGIDPRKWICVEADDLKVATCGDVVMLFMVSTQLADTVTSDQIVTAFEAACGGKLDVVK